MTQETHSTTAIVILAAGQSQRFNGCKVLAQHKGKPLLQWAIEKARACVGEHVYAVTGGWIKEIEEAQTQGLIGPVTTINSPDWEQGLGHSVAAAVSELSNQYDNLLLLAADQIAITETDLNALLQQSDGTHIIAAHYNGQPGIPALFPKAHHCKLTHLSGDRGAKKVLLSQPQSVINIECPNAAIDIDTRADLESIQTP